MTDRCLNRPDGRASRARRAGLVDALTLLGLLMLAPLAACERQAYDAPTGAVAPPPPPPAALAGAPAAPPTIYPDAAPPSMEAPSAAPDPYAAPPVPPSAGGPTGIVAMEPIPNPPEAQALGRRLLHEPARSRRAMRRVRRGAIGARAPALRRVATSSPRRVGPAQVAAAPTAAVSPTRSRVEIDGRGTSTPAAAENDRSRNVADLQSALAQAVRKTAILTAATPGTAAPREMTLTLPADFADTVRTESGRRGLSEAAASVNVQARLSGDDAKVTPDEAQIQPLLSGQSTRFRWTVADASGARGAMHADLTAQLLGSGGDTLDLGAVTAAQPVVSIWKIVGVVLLALVGLTLVAALGRRRARERATSVANRPLPFDMNRTG